MPEQDLEGMREKIQDLVIFKDYDQAMESEFNEGLRDSEIEFYTDEIMRLVQAEVAAVTRKTNISQIENWRDWIKDMDGMAWLVAEMDKAIKYLKDETLTDEHGVYRDALSQPPQQTQGKEDKPNGEE